jgi:hypothetical protein
MAIWGSIQIERKNISLYIHRQSDPKPFFPVQIYIRHQKLFQVEIECSSAKEKGHHVLLVCFFCLEWVSWWSMWPCTKKDLEMKTCCRWSSDHTCAKCPAGWVFFLGVWLVMKNHASSSLGLLTARHRSDVQEWALDTHHHHQKTNKQTTKGWWWWWLHILWKIVVIHSSTLFLRPHNFQRNTIDAFRIQDSAKPDRSAALGRLAPSHIQPT